MPLKLKCRCGEKLSAPESAAGKKGKCPKCGMTFVIPGGPAVGAGASAKPPGAADPSRTASAAGAPSAADPFGLDLPKLGASGPLDDLFDESFDASMTAGAAVTTLPAASSKAKAKAGKAKSSRAGMNSLANGIKLAFVGAIIWILGVIIGMGGEFYALLAGASEFTNLIRQAAVAIAIAGTALAVIGRVLCLSAPPQVGGKAFIFGAVAFDAVGIGVRILSATGEFDDRIGGAVGLVAMLLTITLFVLFIRKVAEALKQKSLVDDASSALTYLILCVVSPGMLMIPIAGPFLTLGFILVTMVKYLGLLQNVAEAARR